MRKKGLEELILQGRVNWKRNRVRQRLTYLESLCNNKVRMKEQNDEIEKPQVED